VAFQFHFENMGEGNPHWGVITAVLNVAKIDDFLATTGAESIQPGIEATVLVFVHLCHRVSDHLEQGWSEIPTLH
jgi:hypothetical protein